MNRNHKLKSVLVTSAMTVMILMAAIYYYWQLYPYKTINYLNDPFPVMPTVVHQGDTVSYNLHYCKYTSKMPVTIKREFVDGLIFTAAEQKALITAEGCGEITVPILIPKSLPSGKYRLRITVEYKVNPIRTITKVVETDEFQVTSSFIEQEKLEPEHQ